MTTDNFNLINDRLDSQDIEMADLKRGQVEINRKLDVCLKYWTEKDEEDRKKAIIDAHEAQQLAKAAKAQEEINAKNKEIKARWYHVALLLATVAMAWDGTQHFCSWLMSLFSRS